MAAEHRDSGRQLLQTRLTRVNTGALNLVPISLEELRRIVFSMPNKASSIDDDLPIYAIKIAFPVIGRILLQIINNSIVTESVPNRWKRAVIIPLHKKGDKSDPSNYRPITNVPTICKIIEKVVHHQLNQYLTSHHLYAQDQHGFRHNHSTSTALISVTDQILWGMDAGEVTLLSLIDLSKGFDVVGHEALLTSLQQLQVAPGWFRSYLQNHSQQVKLSDGSLSSSKDITVGTFQGSSLGPLLFNVATNQLSAYIPSELNGFRVSITRFADDTQVAVTGPRHQLKQLEETMEELLDLMTSWFLQNSMKVNASKTELIMFGSRQSLQHICDLPAVKFMGETLHPSPKVKNLGVIMDSAMTWAPHIDGVVEKCTGILIGILHLKQVLPKHLLIKIVEALVLSHIRYAFQVFGNASKTQLSKINKVIRFAARVVTGRRKYDHVSNVVSKLHWMYAEQQLLYSDLHLMNKIIKTRERMTLVDKILFSNPETQKTTRRSNYLAVPRAHQNSGMRTFLRRASHSYNEHMSAEMLQCGEKTFKRNLRNYCLQQQQDL